MNNAERRHRYDMMGVVAYAEERIKMYTEKHKKPPAILIFGTLEWREIMGCKDDEEFSIASIPVVPDFTKAQGIYLP